MTVKKVLWGVGGLFLALVALVLIAPNLVDWNSYKPEIAAQVRKFTGRELTIGGDIGMKVFPKPTLVAENVVFGNMKGGSAPDMVRLKSVEVRIALAPLLGGNVRVETVRLIEPKILLEVLADGRANWDIKPAEAEPAAAAPAKTNAPAAGGGAGTSGDIAVDNFEIVSGDLTYHDATANTTERVEAINLTLVVGSLAGLVRAEGSLKARGLALGVKANVGTIVEKRTFPLDLTLGVGGDALAATVAGTVTGLNDAPRFRGHIRVNSADIGKIAAAFNAASAIPAPARQPLSVTAKLDGSATRVAVSDLALKLGATNGTGLVEADLGGAVRARIELSLDRIDGDAWISGVAKTAAAPAAPAASSASATGSAAPAAKPAASAAKPAPFQLPKDVTVSTSLKIGAVAYRGDAIRNVTLNADLANGEVTLSQMSAQAPGKSDVAVFGFLTAKNGEPSFEGETEVNVRDAAALMSWLDVSPAGLKAGRPGALKLNAKLAATPKQATVSGLDLQLDQTKITGGATVALRDRLGLGAAVNVDSLDVDSYLAPAAKAKPAEKPASQTGGQASGQTAGQTQGQSAGGTPEPAPSDGPFDGLKALAGFDANLQAKVGYLKAEGVPMRDIAVDISLYNGALTIKKASVGNAAGVAANVSGTLNGLAGTPSAKALAVRAAVADLSGIANILKMELPFPSKSIGDVKLALDLDGALEAPSVKAAVTALAANIDASGKVRPFDLANMLDLAVRVRHPDTVDLMRRVGAVYKPSGKIGGIDVAAKVKGGLTALSFTDIAAALGAVKLAGDANVQLTGARPKIVANLGAGPVVVDPFLPAMKSASLDPLGQATVQPAAHRWTPGAGGFDIRQLIAAVADRWPRTPIDFSAFKSADAEIGLTSPKVAYHEYALENAKLVSSLTAGVLDVKELSGTVFGGAVSSAARVDASSAAPRLAAKVAVSGMDVGKAGQAAGIPGSQGLLTSRVEVASAGQSVADWISALSGKGAIEVKNISGKSSLGDMPIIGLALGPLMQVVELLNGGLGGLFGAGGKKGPGLADLTSSFSIANGVVSTADTRIVSNLYEGVIKGDVNLPAWSMNVGGNVVLSQGLIGALLSTVKEMPSQIPFSVTGSIDKPNVKIQTPSFGSGGGLPIPGLDKLEKKAPGLGGVLQGILGGGSSQQQAPSGQTGGTTTQQQQQQKTQPQQQQQQQQQQAPANPEQLLKKLFRF